MKSSRAASKEALSPSLHLRPRLRPAPEAKRARKEAHAISAAKGKLRALTHRGQGHARSIAALVLVVVVVARRPARSIAAAFLDDAKRGKGEGSGRRSERGPPKLCKLPPLGKGEKGGKTRFERKPAEERNSRFAVLRARFLNPGYHL